MTGLPDRAGIARLVPHAGRMCLLDAVLDWQPGAIRCAAANHRDADHPLRTQSGLLASAAIEYAAQAAALHGALGSVPGSRKGGMLASARGVRCRRLRLDDLPGDLEIQATQLAADAQQLLYGFSVRHDGEEVVTGRLAVVLPAEVAA